MVATVTSFDFPVIEEMKLVSVSWQSQKIVQKNYWTLIQLAKALFNSLRATLTLFWLDEDTE